MLTNHYKKNSDAIFEILKKHITVDYLRDERGDENIRKIKSIEIDDYDYYYETANFYPYIPKKYASDPRVAHLYFLLHGVPINNSSKVTLKATYGDDVLYYLDDLDFDM